MANLKQGLSNEEISNRGASDDCINSGLSFLVYDSTSALFVGLKMSRAMFSLTQT